MNTNEILTERGRPRIIDDSDGYRRLASEWHSGQWSSLYAYASSGSVTVGIGLEISSAISSAERHHPEDVDELWSFLEHVGPMIDTLDEWLETEGMA